MNDSTRTSTRPVSPSRLTKVHIIALSTIALLIIVEHIVIQWVLFNQSTDAYIINIAGRQRMLSQKLSKIALIIQTTPDIKQRQKQLEKFQEALTLWKISHTGLQFGDVDMNLPGQNSVTVTRMFTDIEPHYQIMVSAAQNLLEGGEQNDSIHQLLAEESAFLAKMDAIVAQYELEASTHLEHIKIMTLIIVIIILIVLFWQGKYLFRPAVLQIQQTLRELSQAKDSIQEREILLQAVQELKTEITSHQQTGQALQEIVNLLQKVLSSLNEAVLIVNPNTRQIEECNQTTERMFGYQRSELINQTTLILHVNEEKFRQFSEEFHFAIDKKGFFATEFQMKCKNGEIIATEHFVTPLYQESGELLKVVSVIRDITERKQAELALKESENQFRTLTEMMAVATFICRGENILYVNPAATVVTGYDEAELLKMPFWQIVHPDIQQEVRERCLIFQRSDQIFLQDELKILTKSSQELWLDFTGHIIDYKEKKSVLITAFDVTERRLAEQQFRQLLENAPDAMVIVNQQGIITLVNAQTETVFDYTRTELVGKPVEILIPARFKKQHQQHFVSYSKNPRTQRMGVNIELYGLRQDGSEFPMETSISSLKTAEGLLISSAIRDITERKQAAELERIAALEALQQERALLAKRVDERTAELMSVNAELARASRLKDEFLANMSHELRTPLNAILGMAEVLQDGVYGDINAQQIKSLRTVEESGRHLLSLINDILDLAKIEAGKVKLEIIPVSAEGLGHACLRLIKELAHKKHIKTSGRFDPAVTIIQADERYLKQILINLLSNAIKFTPNEGEVKLEIQGDTKRGVVNFIILDNGVGIAEPDMARLFQPFVQLDGGLNRSHEGTGLGLTLVYRLTELHGGSVTVASEIGKGSCFTVSLPWQPMKIQSQFDNQPPTQKPSLTEATLTETVVLLADDNPSTVETLSDYLKAKGYQVIVAYNGSQAIDKTIEKQPDLVLMDIQMPGVDGLEAIRQIRAHTKTTAIPIIALTALAMPGDKEHCLEAGANDYLSKPVSYSQIIKNINKLLNRKNRI